MLNKVRKLMEQAFARRRAKKLNYESILIVTYGRTGSTLLQGLLNSIDGCLVRGENNQFCYDLFEAYRHIVDIKKTYAPEPTNPFYGAHLLDEKVFLTHAQKMVKALLLAGQNETQVVCYGFKEVRYINVLDSLFEYLDFLQQIFPNTAIVFNTRKVEDTIKSGWWPERDRQETLQNMKKCADLFAEYEKTHPNAFLIKYEDVVSASARVRALFDFLGAEYSDDKIKQVLATPHSYPTKK